MDRLILFASRRRIGLHARQRGQQLAEQRPLPPAVAHLRRVGTAVAARDQVRRVKYDEGRPRTRPQPKIADRYRVALFWC